MPAARWRGTSSLDEVLKSARVLREKGFRQMKTQLALPGDTTPRKEVERARLIREAVGPDTDLMCDINQRWSVNQAIESASGWRSAFLLARGRYDPDDFAGLARVAELWPRRSPAASISRASCRFATCWRPAPWTSR